MLTAAYAFSHFAVDLGCAFAVFSQGFGAWELLLYNLLAFAMQMPLGLLADILKKNRLFSLLGISLVGICCLFPNRSFVDVCLLGLGNGLFHIGGGLDVMDRHPNLAGPLGAFIAPGALGVYLGTVLGKGGRGTFPVLTALLWSLVAILLCRKKAGHIAKAPVKLPEKVILLPALLLFLVVVLRSVGGAVSLPWRSGPLSLVAVCAIILGKMLGGVLSDRLGPIPVSICSLCLSAALFCFADHPAPGLLALLLFNMTMPITLFVLSKMMPNAKGLAFGLLTFALFLGFLPSFFGMPAIPSVAMMGICIASAGLLLPALKAGEHL